MPVEVCMLMGLRRFMIDYYSNTTASLLLAWYTHFPGFYSGFVPFSSSTHSIFISTELKISKISVKQRSTRAYFWSCVPVLILLIKWASQTNKCLSGFGIYQDFFTLMKAKILAGVHILIWSNIRMKSEPLLCWVWAQLSPAIAEQHLPLYYFKIQLQIFEKKLHLLQCESADLRRLDN